MFEVALIAERIYAGKFCQFGNEVPFISHPARVAARICWNYPAPPGVRYYFSTVGWLHDAISIGGAHPTDLQAKFGSDVVADIQKIDRPHNNYWDIYIGLQCIKLYDLIDQAHQLVFASGPDADRIGQNLHDMAEKFSCSETNFSHRMNVRNKFVENRLIEHRSELVSELKAICHLVMYDVQRQAA